MDIKQLDLWVRGISTHSEKTGECCPDMSCCHNSCSATLDVRRDFLNNADNAEVIELYLYVFARNRFAITGQNYEIDSYEKRIH